MRFGVATAIERTTPDELRPLWARLEEVGYDTLTVWDHFEALRADGGCLEAVAMHAALAMSTTTARCGCLVYSVAYRTAPVLAHVAATLDLLSGGRAFLGLGAGWYEQEQVARGYPVEDAGTRSDRLEEATTAITRLLHDDAPVSVDGDHVVLRDATVEPRPVQSRLPVWVGGGGERRTIPMAGRVADGWNVPMATLDDYRRKAALLRRSAEAAGRDPAGVEATVSLGIGFDEAALRERYGARLDAMRPSILSGSTDEVIERVAAYRDAGADTVLLSVRAPFPVEDLERFAAEVVPAFR